MKRGKKWMGIFLAGVFTLLQTIPSDGGNLFYKNVLQNKSISYAAQTVSPSCSYNFNQSVGTALVVTRENDTEEGSNQGTLPSSNGEKEVLYDDGISGKGIFLDGSYGLKLYPQISGDQYSISLWVKPESVQSFAPFLCFGENFLSEEETLVELTGDDTTSPMIISTSPSSGYMAGEGQKITPAQWNHVCVTVNKKQVEIYVNGTRCAGGSILENMVGENTAFYLGIDCYNTLFQGCIDNVEFYDSCLLAENVSALYTEEKSAAVSSEVTGISLNKKELTLHQYGEESPLFATVSPQQAENQGVTWISSDETVATVENGVVFGWKNGTASITAVTQKGNFKAVCSVTVKDILELKGISLSENNLVLDGDGSSFVLIPAANPPAAHLPTLIWSSSDSNVAAVDQAGVVTAVANGTAVILAQSEDGSFSASCSVTVKNVSKEVAVENVEFTEHTLSLTNKTKSHALTTKVTPSNAANQQCTYYSEDQDVAIVNNAGLVTAVGNGTTNICVISSDGRFTDSCKVTVTGFAETKIKSIQLDYDSLKIAQGDIGYLYATTSPLTATEELTWSSSNTQVADVVPDEYGTSAEIIVYADAVMGSTAMITAYTEEGVSAECFIEVEEYGVKKISIEQSSVSLIPGEKFAVDAEITPQEASSAELLWTSSNQKVASVNAKGIVTVKKTAQNGDTAKITSMTLSKTKKESLLVTVKEKKVAVKKLKAKKKKFTLYPGQNAKFSVTYSPSNATENKISYTSQNSKIVKVDKNGKISVPSDYSGTAKVKVTAKAKSGKKITALVTVKQREVKIKKLSMSRSNLEVYSGKSTTLYVNYKPSNATKTNLTWTSSNQDVVKVTGNGKKAAIQVKNLSSKKTATITAKDSNGATATCRLSVLPRSSTESSETQESNKNNSSSTNSNSSGNNTSSENSKTVVKSISFGTQSYIAVKRGKSIDLKQRLSIMPTDAGYKLTWQSKNNYVSVSSQGVASVSSKAPKKLRSTILVTTDNGKKAAIDILVQ